MTEITYFIAVPFDYVDDDIVAGEPIRCPSPAVAIERAHGDIQRCSERLSTHQAACFKKHLEREQPAGAPGFLFLNICHQVAYIAMQTVVCLRCRSGHRSVAAKSYAWITGQRPPACAPRQAVPMTKGGAAPCKSRELWPA